MAALRSLGSTLVWRARPAFTRSFRQPQRNHRLTPSDDELLQKTTLHRLERESPNIMFIENYTNYGFSINGNTVVGPCAILPQAILQWNVKIVVLGTGAKLERLDPNILKCLQQRGIAVEVQSTPNACATFNFLVNEQRVTAAGLIPPPPAAMLE
ncbi:NADH dehydrogenase [ubiquinone] 1 alpha subcomplex assembly factor 3 [Ophiophagus hannah]|uniref:NADH dehydrogenase [ubiquinone] 1 alpha subcomplex assembly factor 3 n=1 Tax=Ophiophagus hannah TaxID=8665 RepID=V8NV96_OPHHA|nr:NADH dehydrogenase [ubiquinone] 1 alpha subcomplex assembly factor 3 [Ophiophagus hannah]